MASQNHGKQNVTISLSREVLKKARILAARRETSISGLLAQEIDSSWASRKPMSRLKARLGRFSQKAFTWAA